MDQSAYPTMKDLIHAIGAKLEKLEKGELQASGLPELVEESRELYERLVVLRYKAMERSLIGESQAKPVVKEEERPVTPFKINVAKPAENTQQISILDLENEVKKEEPQPEISIAPKMEVKEEIKAPVSVEVPKVVETPSVQQHTMPSSLNEKLQQSQQQKTSLAEKLQKKPISDLKTAIGLNQKFLFMNDLFEGENAAYNEALNLLNNFSSMDDAKNYLLTLGTKYNWDLESDSVVQFTDLVERRYS
jgi:hypothetical protein